MSRKAAWLFVAVLGLAVIVPQVVYAATGTFTSSSGSTALTATNSSTGRAINATSKTSYTAVLTRTATSGTTATLYAVQKSESSGASAVYGFSTNNRGGAYGVYGRSAAGAGRGVFGYATSTVGETYGVYGRSAAAFGRGVFGYATNGAGGSNYGVYGRTLGTGDGSTGVYGFASATGDGATCGVCGRSNSDFGLGIGGVSYSVGALGLGDVIGVYGTSGLIGDGSAGIFTDTDAAFGGHVLALGTDIAGTCTIATGQTASPDCNFANAFPPGTSPIIVVTPTSDPGSVFFVSDPAVGDATTGFKVNLATAPGAAVDFNYLVVGVNETLLSSAGARASSAKASGFAKQR